MESTTNSLIDKVVSGLRNAAIELEEFQLQLALGKAEASDKYEEVKKKFSAVIHEAKEKLNEGKTRAIELKMKFEELQVQLALGITETREAFLEQKAKIFKTVSEIEAVLRASAVGEYYLKLHNEIEKFKIKMEILRLRFELGKLYAEKEFETAKMEFAKKVDQFKRSFVEKENSVDKNWDHFCDEISVAYSHFKKAFEKV